MKKLLETIQWNKLNLSSGKKRTVEQTVGNLEQRETSSNYHILETRFYVVKVHYNLRIDNR